MKFYPINKSVKDIDVEALRPITNIFPNGGELKLLHYEGKLREIKILDNTIKVDNTGEKSLFKHFSITIDTWEDTKSIQFTGDSLNPDRSDEVDIFSLIKAYDGKEEATLKAIDYTKFLFQEAEIETPKITDREAKENKYYFYLGASKLREESEVKGTFFGIDLRQRAIENGAPLNRYIDYKLNIDLEEIRPSFIRKANFPIKIVQQDGLQKGFSAMIEAVKNETFEAKAESFREHGRSGLSKALGFSGLKGM